MGRGQGIGLFRNTVGARAAHKATNNASNSGGAAQSRQPTTQPAGSAKREHLLSQVTNPKLRDAIKGLYREGATVGDGGTADAIRQESKTGNPVGDKGFHAEKGRGRLRQLKRIINSRDLTAIERKITNELIADLEDALKGVK